MLWKLEETAKGIAWNYQVPEAMTRAADQAAGYLRIGMAVSVILGLCFILQAFRVKVKAKRLGRFAFLWNTGMTAAVLWWATDTNTVSYTHLDVYKRQEKRSALEKKVAAIATPVKIGDKELINQYLLELDTLGEWDKKESLSKTLNGYLGDIAARKKLVDVLDKDIWNQVDPLDVYKRQVYTLRLQLQMGN